MKKTIKIILSLFILTTIMFSCKTTNENAGIGKVSDKVRKPEFIDHKNLKWNKEIPNWVTEDTNNLEKLPKYKDSYLFRFESDRSKSLEGAKLWTKNFSAPSEMARLVKTRVKEKAAAAAAGDKDKIVGYLEDVVKLISDTKLHGFKKESDYWVQMRYFDAQGKPAGDDFTYVILYSIKKSNLDKLISDAMSGADQVKPKTDEEKAVRERVKEALNEGI